LMLLVGVGVWAYYQHFPEHLTGQAAEAVDNNTINVLPVFVLTEVSVGLRGLIIAGVFAAAISSLTSILAALSQTTMSAVYMPLRKIDSSQPGKQREVLFASRVWVLIWGIALCAMAFAIDAYVTSMEAQGKDVPFLDLALGLASYVIGALLAAFLLAWLPLKVSGYGLIWSAALSGFTIYAARFHDPAAPWQIGWPESAHGWLADHLHLLTTLAVSVALLGSWLISAAAGPAALRGKRFAKTPILLAGCVMMIIISVYGWFPAFGEGGEVLYQEGDLGLKQQRSIAWPWYAPIGATVAFIWGWALADRREPAEEMPAVQDQVSPSDATPDTQPHQGSAS